MAKYVQVDNEKVLIEVERGPDVSMLDINIELPATTEARRAKAPARRRLEGAAAAT
ncbi:MAG: hypothetical protein ACR2P3_12710 [Geminicoccaceae bacterium]